MTNTTHKNYNNTSTNSFKNKNLTLRELLQECLPIITDMIEGCAMDEESDAYFKDLHNRICAKLNIKRKKRSKKR